MISYLGIDPGLSGGLAVVSDDRIQFKIAMPTISLTTKEGITKTEIDRQGVLSFLKILPEHTHVVIEEQLAYRSQNIIASCTICKNYGIILMALTVAHMYITEVPPDVWQEHFGIVSVKKAGGKTTKEQALEVVKAIFPNVDLFASERSTKEHDGITDALLIAEYGRRRDVGVLSEE